MQHVGIVERDSGKRESSVQAQLVGQNSALHMGSADNPRRPVFHCAVGSRGNPADRARNGHDLYVSQFTECHACNGAGHWPLKNCLVLYIFQAYCVISLDFGHPVRQRTHAEAHGRAHAWLGLRLCRGTSALRNKRKRFGCPGARVMTHIREHAYQGFPQCGCFRRVVPESDLPNQLLPK